MTTTTHRAPPGDQGLLEAALASLRLAEADPRRSLTVAGDVARRARRDGDLEAASVAERARGVAALHLQGTAEATRHLRLAVALGQRADRPAAVTEARLRLAAVLNLAGRPRAALRQIDSALAELTGLEQSRAWAQRGAIELQLDHLERAAGDLERAVPGLRSAGDPMWLKRALANRGLVHARRGRFAAAEADLREALRLNQELGIELSVAFVEQNLGWVHTLAGDVPRALERLDRAEEALRRLGAQVGFLLDDRARLLLSVGLVAEATVAAQEAVLALQRERQTVAVPDARLILARAALLDADPEKAALEAGRAAKDLRRLGRTESAAQARLVMATALFDTGLASRIRLPALRTVAEELERQGWLAESVQARMLVAELESRRGVGDRGRQQLADAARRRGRSPAAVRALAWQAAARLHELDGRPPDALRALRAGLRVLDEQRAGLGGSDLRASTGRRRTQLSAEGLRLAVRTGRAATIFAWAEQGRASQFLLPAVVPQDDPALAASLAALRTAHADVEAARGSGLSPARALGALATAEHQVRRRARRRTAPGTGVRRPVMVTELMGRLGDAALVEYVEMEGDLFAVLVASGTGSWVPLGPAAMTGSLLERLLFGLRRLELGRGEVAARRMLEDTARRLEEVLLLPLAGVIGERPLVVVPTGRLHSVPWSLLPWCQGRAVSVAPSATSWWAASQPEAATGPVVAVAGPGLPGAEREARQVARLYGAAPLVGPAATASAALSAMSGASVVHLAAHGRLHAQHPLFSAVVLHDGPLTAYDLEQVEPPPALVVLSACESGHNAVAFGDELLGLTASLLTRGVRAVVAPLVPVRDDETAPLMAAFHRALRSGVTADVALAEAQRAGADPDLAAAFVCLGGRLALR